MKRMWIMIALASALGALGGCASGEDSGTEATAMDEAQTYTVRGVYRERAMDGDGMRVTHEEIPGYMSAMTMDFPVRDTSEVAKLADGDKIEFTLTLTATEGYAHGIQVLDPETELVLPSR